MKTSSEIRKELRDSELRSLGQADRFAELVEKSTKSPLNPAESNELAKLKEKLQASRDEQAALLDEWRNAMTSEYKAGKFEGAIESGEDRSVHFMKQTSYDVDVRTSTPEQLRSAASKKLELEHRDQKVPISDETAAKLERDFGRRTVTDDGQLQFDGSVLARRFLVTESDSYRRAFQKGLMSQTPAWEADEIRAINEFRATEQSLTNASGGYGVPVSLDPTVIITSGAQDAPLLQVSRIESITSNVWKGVSSDGITFTATAEATAATATQATLVQPTITPEKTMAYIPFSFEIQGDYPSFAAEMQKLIEQGYVDYVAVESAVGSAGVVGIFTAIDATAGSEVATTTAGQLGPEDALKVFKALPERARNRASWFMDVSVESELRNASAMNGLYTNDLSSQGIGPLLGKRVLLSDYAPAFTGTTGAENLAIVGDFSKYVIAQRVGMNIELIPNVVDGNGVPTGQRAWLAWARIGADSVDDSSFRLLQTQ